MELEKKIDELGTVFESFKKANDARLKEIETKGAASGSANEKVDKLSAAMTALEADIEKRTTELKMAMNRTNGGGEGPGKDAKAERSEKNAQHAKEIALYMQKGIEPSRETIEWARKDMSVDSDGDGGFLVSPELSAEIVLQVYESSPIRQLASVQTIGSDALEILEDLDQASSGWVGERDTRGSTGSPKLQKIAIPVHELYAEPVASQKILDDASMNLEAWLSGKVTDKFARDEATAFISGTGVLKPKGILAYASAKAFNSIERLTSSSNSALASDDLIDVQSILKEPYQKNATWLMNRLFVAQVRKLKDSYGQYMWQPGLSGVAPPTLLGAPVMFAADLPAAYAATTDSIIYGDIKQAYQIVDRIGVRVLRDPFTVKGSILFYTTKRVGGGVKNFEAVKILRTKT